MEAWWRLRFWKLSTAVCFFAPPIPLWFTPTESSVSLALPMALAYLSWRLAFPRTPGGEAPPATVRTAKVLAGYTILHAAYFLLVEPALIASLSELQWAIYLLAFFLQLHDLRAVPRWAVEVRRWLVLIGMVEGAAAVITAFTGPIPIYFYGAFFEARWGLDVYRATGTIGSPNALGGILAFILLTALFTRPEVLPARRVICALPMALGLLATQSKSAMAVLSIGILAAVLRRMIARRRLRDALALVLIAGLAAAALAAIGEVLGEDYSERREFTTIVLDKYLSSDPFHLVIGLGFRQTAEVDPGTLGWLTAHNSYVSLLAEIGAVGLALVAAILARALRARDEGIFAASVGLVAHAYTESFLYGFAYLLLLAFAALCADDPVQQERRLEPDAVPASSS